MPAAVFRAVHFHSELGYCVPSLYPYRIDSHQFLELLVVRNILKRISAGGHRSNRAIGEQTQLSVCQYLRILRKGVAKLRSKQEEAFPVLRHAEVPCVQYAPRLGNGISAFFKLRNQ